MTATPPVLGRVPPPDGNAAMPRGVPSRFTIWIGLKLSSIAVWKPSARVS
ncbi:MAG TPA: hypothetical protein VFP84_26320 [Kofleriaceae bacterium]|nr:hypothetical protein [Kofleriaceae bacterium]